MRVTKKRRVYETVRRLGVTRPCLLVTNGDMVQETVDYFDKLLMRETVPIQRAVIVYNFGGRRGDIKRLQELLSEKFGRNPLTTIHALGYKILTRYLRKTYKGNVQPYVVAGTRQEEIARAAAGMAGIELNLDKIDSFIKKIRGAKAHLFYPPFSTTENEDENEFFRFFTEYEKLLRQKRAYDHEDLIGHAFSALRDNPWLIEEFRFKYRYIVAYNYQQLTYAQKCFLALLTGQGKEIGFYAIGSDDFHLNDDWYSWKGAVSEFRKDYPLGDIIIGDPVPKTTKQIAQVAYNIIKKKTSRIEKNDYEFMQALPDGSNVTAIITKDTAGEMRFVLSEIQKLFAQGIKPQEIGLVFFNPKYIGAFAKLLKDANIPYSGQTKKREPVSEGVSLSSLSMVKNQFFDYVFLLGLDMRLNAEDDTQLNSIFIGMTRARKKLFLTMAKQRKGGSQYREDEDFNALLGGVSDKAAI